MCLSSLFSDTDAILPSGCWCVSVAGLRRVGTSAVLVHVDSWLSVGMAELVDPWTLTMAPFSDPDVTSRDKLWFLDSHGNCHLESESLSVKGQRGQH